ncbi:MAG: WG repeat-containing protein [Candidatus Peribacteria bacterium]|nr:WG repeat-containing protein [Candidatus Peribacteria bacterium]
MKKDKKRGFIDKTGKEIVPCEYDDVCDFSD